jgi:hypothetical protein
MARGSGDEGVVKLVLPGRHATCTVCFGVATVALRVGVTCRATELTFCDECVMVIRQKIEQWVNRGGI